MNPATNALYAIFRNIGKAVPAKIKHRIFVDFCRHIGVTKVRVTSPYGEISGLIADQACFGTFVQRRIWAPEINNLVLKFFSGVSAGTYIDIGANIGLTTLPAAQLGHITCHAFEPDPQNFTLLSENVGLNASSQNIHLHNLAMFSSDMNLTFELSPTNHGDHRVRIGDKPSTESFAEHTRQTISVPGRRLDQVISVVELPLPIFAKIDTEGCEAHVLEGGMDVLQHADVIILEFWPYAMVRADSNIRRMLDVLETHFPFAVAVEHNESLDPADLRPIGDVRPTLENFIAAAGGADRLELMVAKRLDIFEKSGRV